MYRRSVRMDDLGNVLILVLSYRGSSVVGPVYDRDRQVFWHTPIFAFVKIIVSRYVTQSTPIEHVGDSNQFSQCITTVYSSVSR